jgi:glyoxylase-like metal-dependent hydrolase (beta-lactamase superfamily II)
MSETYEIFVLKYAEMLNRIRADNFIGSDDHTSPGPIDYFVWVVRNEQRTIVVDTGFDVEEGGRRGRVVLRTPAAALAMFGVDATAVRDVVITHLHFDHAGTLSSFPNATFHLQAAEMAFATGPSMCHPHMRWPFTAEHVCEVVRNVYSGRVMFYDGDSQIAPGITLHKIGGHSPGLQAVTVMTANGLIVLASDAAHFYETFELGRPFPIVVDMEAVQNGYATLKRLAGDPRQIVPGHDPLVLKRYPPLTAASAGIVHRLDVPRRD